MDATFRESLGAARLPAPSTRGDYLRLYSESDMDDLQRASAEVRLPFWKVQKKSFFLAGGDRRRRHDRRDAGEWKEGIGLSRGCLPLVLALAKTEEVQFAGDRPGNRPSLDGAAEWMERAGELAEGRDALFLLHHQRGPPRRCFRPG